MTCNEVLKRVRLALGLTQEQMAHMAGIERGHLAHYESGRTNLSLPRAMGLLAVVFERIEAAEPAAEDKDPEEIH